MNLDEFEMKMMKAIDNLEERYVSIRAGRANPSMLNGVMVDFYGTPTPISSIANITVPEARQLFIKPFDRSTLKNIEHAIIAANLGINPTNNGEMLIITIPALTEDKRREYVKQAKALSEDAKVDEDFMNKTFGVKVNTYAPLHPCIYGLLNLTT